MAAHEQLITADEFSQIQFDFLVIGGGTAGLAVAARLSEHPRFKVGVLEAGSLVSRQDTIDIPGLYGQAIGTKQDWQFETVPQKGLAGRVLPWPRGKIVGGTSAINFMIWNRGSKEDYNAWEQLGNPGWGWEDLLPFFKKSETVQRPSPDIESNYGATFDAAVSGVSGPIKISYPNYYPTTHQLWRQSLNSLGVESNDTHMSGSNTGVWTCINSVTPDERIRSYATNSYYTPNAHRKNLFLLTDALVNEISLEPSENGDHRATGVSFTCKNQQYQVSVNHEVVLSAGAVQSPQILELSGIGNPEILAKAGIPTKVVSSKVGENLQDHIMAAIIFEINSTDGRKDQGTDKAGPDSALEEYLQQASGPLTAVPSCFSYLPLAKVMATTNFQKLHESVSVLPDVDIERRNIVSGRFDTTQQLGQIEYILDLGNWNPYYTPDQTDHKKYATIFQILQYPFSRGSIHISSTSSDSLDQRPNNQIFNAPLIDPQYYDGPHGLVDLETMTHSLQFAEKIVRSEPLSNVVGERVFPPSSTTTDEDYRDWMSKTTITDWHPVGTCSMGGTLGISEGVVDHRLRVYGVRGLRVIDASIMPLHISSHIQATVYAIAEKGAHMILEDYGVLE
ncbi:hypothetical protein N7495_007202 [Penicillium taxi]|uniref:uncharacterized protein n=1 Tax=Penicillium taxi TaxID=168475 RepID=UPI002545ABC1|nr:uncharacterized protein N7495_007202 [Penicillium taxi]KAJ5895511.1 hypothetical protein N7495_007202 [Penicillium taxi]